MEKGRSVFLLKSELCQNTPNFACSFVYVDQTMFCMFFSLKYNVLHVFSLKFAYFLFEILCTYEKHIFLRASSEGLLLNEKQKKAFVSLNNGVNIIHESLTTTLLAQVHKVLNWLDSSLFCCDAVSIGGRGRSNFFHSVSLLLSKTKISIYLCVFVIELPFLITRKDQGLICFFLAGIVT